MEEWQRRGFVTRETAERIIKENMLPPLGKASDQTAVQPGTTAKPQAQAPKTQVIAPKAAIKQAAVSPREVYPTDRDRFDVDNGGHDSYIRDSFDQLIRGNYSGGVINK